MYKIIFRKKIMLGLCAWVVVIELDEADIQEHGRIMFNV